jgi:hypothetical protein
LDLLDPVLLELEREFKDRADMRQKISYRLALQSIRFVIKSEHYYGINGIDVEDGALMCDFTLYDPDSEQPIDIERFNRMSEKYEHFSISIGKGDTLLNDKHSAVFHFTRGRKQTKVRKYINRTVRLQMVEPDFYLPKHQNTNMLYLAEEATNIEVKFYADQLLTIFYGQTSQIPVSTVTNTTISLLAQMRFKYIKEFIKHAWDHGGLHREADKNILLQVLGYPEVVPTIRSASNTESESDAESAPEPFGYQLPPNFDWRAHVTNKLQAIENLV